MSELGWRLLPIYKGRQAPCGGKPADQKITPSAAASQGTFAADDASASVRALGMIKGSAIFYDMEHYTTTDTACRTAVLQFLSAWTKELHRLGYVSGVYANLNLGARDLANVYNSRLYARPDALWIARYDGNSSLTGWAGISDSMWAVHQRAKQYRANVGQTYGGVTINIDIDNVDAPVGTTAFGYTVTSAGPLKARSGPGRSYPVVKQYPAGASVTVVCQAPGSTVGSTKVWDKLTDSTYVSDLYVSTPSSTGFSAPVTRCRYPYQVTASDGVNQRSAPGTSYSITGRLPGGGLAWLTCQQAGSKVGTTRIWDKISYRHCHRLLRSHPEFGELQQARAALLTRARRPPNKNGLRIRVLPKAPVPHGRTECGYAMCSLAPTGQGDPCAISCPPCTARWRSGVELAGEVFQAAVDLDRDHAVAGAKSAGDTQRRGEIGTGRGSGEDAL